MINKVVVKLYEPITVISVIKYSKSIKIVYSIQRIFSYKREFIGIFNSLRKYESKQKINNIEVQKGISNKVSLNLYKFDDFSFKSNAFFYSLPFEVL